MNEFQNNLGYMFRIVVPYFSIRNIPSQTFSNFNYTFDHFFDPMFQWKGHLHTSVPGEMASE